jgi:hypothetical protein
MLSQLSIDKIEMSKFDKANAFFNTVLDFSHQNDHGLSTIARKFIDAEQLLQNAMRDKAQSFTDIISADTLTRISTLNVAIAKNQALIELLKPLKVLVYLLFADIYDKAVSQDEKNKLLKIIVYFLTPNKNTLSDFRERYASLAFIEDYFKNINSFVDERLDDASLSKVKDKINLLKIDGALESVFDEINQCLRKSFLDSIHDIKKIETLEVPEGYVKVSTLFAFESATIKLQLEELRKLPDNKENHSKIKKFEKAYKKSLKDERDLSWQMNQCFEKTLREVIVEHSRLFEAAKACQDKSLRYALFLETVTGQSYQEIFGEGRSEKKAKEAVQCMQVYLTDLRDQGKFEPYFNESTLTVKTQKKLENFIDAFIQQNSELDKRRERIQKDYILDLIAPHEEQLKRLYAGHKLIYDLENKLESYLCMRNSLVNKIDFNALCVKLGRLKTTKEASEESYQLLMRAFLGPLMLNSLHPDFEKFQFNRIAALAERAPRDRPQVILSLPPVKHAVLPLHHPSAPEITAGYLRLKYKKDFTLHSERQQRISRHDLLAKQSEEASGICTDIEDAQKRQRAPLDLSFLSHHKKRLDEELKASEDINEETSRPSP